MRYLEQHGETCDCKELGYETCGQFWTGNPPEEPELDREMRMLERYMGTSMVCLDEWDILRFEFFNLADGLRVCKLEAYSESKAEGSSLTFHLRHGEVLVVDGESYSDVCYWAGILHDCMIADPQMLAVALRTAMVKLPGNGPFKQTSDRWMYQPSVDAEATCMTL